MFLVRFEAILMKTLPASPSWPPCFRDLGLREQPRADLSAAACFRGDNNSLIPQIELYFPSPSSSILLTFTFHPPLHLHLPPRQPAATRAPAAMTALRRAVRVQARDGRQIQTILFPLCSSHHPRLILRFFISFSSVSFPWNYLELPGIKVSPNSMQHHLFYFGFYLDLMDAHFLNNHDYVIMFLFFFSRLLRHSDPDLFSLIPRVCLPSDCTWFWEELQIYKQGGLLWKSKQTDAFTFASYSDETAQSVWLRHTWCILSFHSSPVPQH